MILENSTETYTLPHVKQIASGSLLCEAGSAYLCAQSLQSCPVLCDHIDYISPGSSVHGIPQAEYWNGLLCSPLEDLSNPVIKPLSPASPAWQADSLSTEQPGRQGAQGQSQCSVTTQRAGIGKEVGGRFRREHHMSDSCQCMSKTTAML